MPGFSEWVVILLIILLLFGAKRLPEIAKSLGKGINEFKKAIKGEDNEEDKKLGEGKK
ncbi:MAG: twin-arginine translocase TatA/TatE family subunit [Chlamydiae bacterium]|nr:twin-arginine translocase TatA/TatE family subunit [Chlamydiota bacterium]